MNSTHHPDTPPKILIVEDEKNLADLFAQWLETTYDVETAYAVTNALDLLDDSFDVLLLDRRMPESSGDAVLEHVREHDLDIRVAIVSAVEPDVDVIGMEFDAYLTKPISRDELRDTVTRMLERSHYSDDLQELAQLVATKAALESTHAEQTLHQDEEYQTLLERIEAMDAEIEEHYETFESEDFAAMYREFGTEIDESDSSE